MISLNIMDIDKMENVGSKTRSGKDGKRIVCPLCTGVQRVYHFSWSSLKCINCKSFVDKNKWKVDNYQPSVDKSSKVV